MINIKLESKFTIFTKRKLFKFFKEYGFIITVEYGLIETYFLDVTLNVLNSS